MIKPEPVRRHGAVLKLVARIHQCTTLARQTEADTAGDIDRTKAGRDLGWAIRGGGRDLGF